MPTLMQHGYAVYECMPLRSIAAIRDAIDQTITRVARAMQTPIAQSCPGLSLEQRLQAVGKLDPAYAGALLGCVLADTQHDPAVACLVEDLALRSDLERELGPVEWTGGAVRIRANVPALPQRRQGWHSDVAFDYPVTPGSTCHTVLAACWIPLGAVDADNGTLEVAPMVLDRPLVHDALSEGAYVIPEERLGNGPRQIMVCRPGEVVYLDRYTPHRALPNHSDDVRWSVVVWLKGQRLAAQSSSHMSHRSRMAG